MKKLIISLITGAVLTGIGIGVLLMEIAEFSMTDIYPEIKNAPLQEYSYTDETVFEDAGENREVNLYCYLGGYFDDFGKLEIVEDQNVDGIEITVKYRGDKPSFNFHGYAYEHRGYEYEYSISAYSDDIMPKQILEMAEYMCTNKTIVKYQDLFYVENVTVKTSQPQLINCEF